MLRKSLLLLVTLFTFFTHGVAFAIPEVNVGKVTVPAGATKVTVPVNFVANGATNVASFDIVVSYDGTKLSNPVAAIGAAATAASKGLDTILLTNPTAIEAVVLAPNANAVSSGVLYTLTFDISASAVGATIPLNITFIEVADNGAPTQIVTVTPVNGSVTVPDTNPPTVTAFDVPDTVTTFTIPITTLEATRADTYLITQSSTAPLASDAGWGAKPTTYTVTQFGTYTLFAWAKNSNGVSAPFAEQTVSVVSTPAPVLTITAPANNFVTGSNTVEVIGTAIQNPLAGSGAVASVKVNNVDATLGVDGAFSSTVTLNEGSNNITVVAADNHVPAVTTTVSVTVIYDITPPTLDVSMLSAGSSTNVTPQNISGTATDANGIKSVTVNGTATTVAANGTFSFALPLEAPDGEKVVTVVATDNADNQTTFTRTIIYDTTAMTLTVTAPADNSQTKETAVTVTGTISETGGTVEIKNTTNGANITPVAATVTGTDYTGSIALLSNSLNTIEVTVTDPAGNTSTSVKRTVLQDSTLPSLAITAPAQDILLEIEADTPLTITGTVGDSLTPVTDVTLTFNGATFPQTVTDGAFEQVITVPGTADKSYPVVVTAKDAVGNQSSVTRNIVVTAHPADIDPTNPQGTTGIEELVKASQVIFTNGILTDTEKIRLDVAPLGSDGKPSPNGVVDSFDLILLLRRSVGLTTW